MATAAKRIGDRKDGRRIRTLSPFSKMIPYIMKQRNDALNYYEESFEVSIVDRQLRHERVSGYKGIGFLHFIIAAYVRCVSMLPALNRFVVGSQIYARNNIEVVLAVKRSMSLGAEETTIKVEFQPTDTIFDVYRKLNAKIDEVKSDTGNNNTEDMAETLLSMPSFIAGPIIGFFKLTDKWGILPKSIVEASPFHGSMIITDLGSLKIGPVFHHIYNFGTLSVFMAFGSKRHVKELDRHGDVVDRKYVDMKFTLDERIADGQYYAHFLRAMRYLFAHPEILEVSPSRVVKDID